MKFVDLLGINPAWHPGNCIKLMTFLALGISRPHKEFCSKIVKLTCLIIRCSVDKIFNSNCYKYIFKRLISVKVNLGYILDIMKKMDRWLEKVSQKKCKTFNIFTNAPVGHLRIITSVWCAVFQLKFLVDQKCTKLTNSSFLFCFLGNSRFSQGCKNSAMKK